MNPNWQQDREELTRRYHDQGIYGSLTLAEAMREGAATHPDVSMIFHSDTHPAEATLGEMHRRSLDLAGSLYALGLSPGDAIAIQVPNWLEGALVFSMTSRAPGVSMTVKLVDIFTIDDAGKIVSMRAFWDQSCMSMG